MGELIVGERARAVKMLVYGLLLRQVVFTSKSDVYYVLTLFLIWGKPEIMLFKHKVSLLYVIGIFIGNLKQSESSVKK